MTVAINSKLAFLCGVVFFSASVIAIGVHDVSKHKHKSKYLSPDETKQLISALYGKVDIPKASEEARREEAENRTENPGVLKRSLGMIKRLVR